MFFPAVYEKKRTESKRALCPSRFDAPIGGILPPKHGQTVPPSKDCVYFFGYANKTHRYHKRTRSCFSFPPFTVYPLYYTTIVAHSAAFCKGFSPVKKNDAAKNPPRSFECVFLKKQKTGQKAYCFLPRAYSYGNMTCIISSFDIAPKNGRRSMEESILSTVSMS